MYYLLLCGWSAGARTVERLREQLAAYSTAQPVIRGILEYRQPSGQRSSSYWPLELATCKASEPITAFSIHIAMSDFNEWF